MSNLSQLFGSMEHDGLANPPTAHTLPTSAQNPDFNDLAANVDSTSVVPSGSTTEDIRAMTAPGRVTHLPHGAENAYRRRSSSALGSNRIFCPVVGCPDALASSNRYFRDFASIKTHLNDHCTGHLSGAVPVDFLRHYEYTQCNVCDKVLHNRYNGTCPKCRPMARAHEQINIMRNRVIPPDSNPSISRQSQSAHDLPSLSDIYERFVPTIKNIPKGLRSLFAQCLTKALARAVWSNSEETWTELQMLPKSTLCRPARGGKSHRSQRLAWTRGRLHRWFAGERTQLWQDLPQYKRPKPKRYSAEATVRQRQERCINLTSEGGLSNACKSLVSPPPLSNTAEVAGRLADKHPLAERPVDLRKFGNASSALVPLADVGLVEQCIRSFHRLSGGGPTGLRPIHLKNCISTVHRDEVLEQCCALINILAKGDAPISLAPFLAGASLTALPKKDDGIRPVAVGEV